MKTPDELDTALRDYVLHRQEEVGFHTAVQEINTALHRIARRGTGAKPTALDDTNLTTVTPLVRLRGN
jgi:hypothetical protein